MTSTLTKAQDRKLYKLTSGQGYGEPAIQVSEIDAAATVTYWLSQHSYREIVLTKGGKVITDHQDTIIGK